MTPVASAPVRNGNTNPEDNQNPSRSLSRSPVCDGESSPDSDTGNPNSLSRDPSVSTEKPLPTRKMPSLGDTNVGKGSEVGVGQRGLSGPQASPNNWSTLNQDNLRESALSSQEGHAPRADRTSNTLRHSGFHEQNLDRGGILKVDRGAQPSPWGDACDPGGRDDGQGWDDSGHTHGPQARSQPQPPQQFDASYRGQERGVVVQSSMKAAGSGDRLYPVAGQPRERPRSSVQVASKRKRVFSNRTKTGCLTCRKRKKKCDEQHPTCEFTP